MHLGGNGGRLQYMQFMCRITSIFSYLSICWLSRYEPNYSYCNEIFINTVLMLWCTKKAKANAVPPPTKDSFVFVRRNKHNAGGSAQCVYP